jgi:prepilin-type N-terminal cleavage/methylation domain-containing protein
MPKQQHHGMTLLELLIGLVISSILFLAAYAVLQHNFHSKHTLEQKINEQQSARYTQHVLSQAICMAGYFGCHRMQASQIRSSLRSLIRLRSYNQALPTAFHATSDTTNDTLFVYHLAANAIQLSQPMQSNKSALTLPSKIFNKNSIVVISDCLHADIFAVSHVEGKASYTISHTVSRDNKTDEFSKLYLTGAYIGAFVADQFYVKNQGLYERQINNRSEELLSGVKSMRLSFSTQQAAHHFIDTKNFRAWNNVAMVNVRILLNSEKMIHFTVRARNT